VFGVLGGGGGGGGGGVPLFPLVIVKMDLRKYWWYIVVDSGCR